MSTFRIQPDAHSDTHGIRHPRHFLSSKFSSGIPTGLQRLQLNPNQGGKTFPNIANMSLGDPRIPPWSRLFSVKLHLGNNLLELRSARVEEDSSLHETSHLHYLAFRLF